ncbi:MAG: molybdopterin-dependent oxidoreductase [Acidobacteriota bacterium]
MSRAAAPHAPARNHRDAPWHATACILCSLNCGVEVQVDDRHMLKIRGDREHPVSLGYQCQKAARLDFYQNGSNRLTEPLKRRTDGGYEAITWRQAISEVAAKLKHLRDTHGGHSLAYYGGGGQGNHMGGVHSSTLRAAMGTRYIYNSLAQEKTGGFWVNGELFGRQTLHTSEDVERSDYVVFIGTNPWQSHGFPQARKVINEIAKDPDRTMVVVDPRRTETAKKADVFLQVQPGGDAALMLAMLGTLVQEGLENRDFLRQRTTGWPAVKRRLEALDVDAYARRAGLEPNEVRQVARDYAAAERGCIRTDLGLEHSPNSTLNVYLSKLLFLITGHFGRPGTVNLHSYLLPLIGHSKTPEEGGVRTQVTGMREISKFMPPNILPAEIDSDHPGRTRGVVVDSANPLMTAADTGAYRAAFEKLELLVVIDVAMTETARMADYVLPASSQFEKWEATLFNLEFPSNFFHLRRPLFEPRGNTLTEPEIYRRIAVAMGELPDDFPVLRRIAALDREIPKMRLFPLALKATLALRPGLKKFVPIVVHETLGAALPDGAKTAAALWGACQFYAGRHADAIRRVGIEDRGAGLGEALFSTIMERPSGTLISTHTAEEMWSWIRHADGKIHLEIPEMLQEIEALAGGADAASEADAFPYVLLAGERRSYNANTIIRENSWRKKDADGALKLNAADADDLGLGSGDLALCESSRGSLRVRVEITDELKPGVVSMPHGYGMVEGEDQHGPAINELTDAARCDAVAKTPFHKYVPVRITALGDGPAS